MKLFIFLYSLLLSSTLYAAQKTLQEIRVEENLFIMKIIGVVILILVVMPIILRQLKNLAPKTERHQPLPVEQETKPKKKKKSALPDDAEEENTTTKDPVDTALESLFNERRIPQEKRDGFTPLYRRYLELRMGKVEIKKGSFDINKDLDTVKTKGNALEDNRKFEIVLEIDANVPSQLNGEAKRMEEILFFLIQNVVLKSSS